MPVTITYDGTTPTIGGSEDVWGDVLNEGMEAVKVDLDALALGHNALEETVTDGLAANGEAITALQGDMAKALLTGEVRYGLWAAAPDGWIKSDGGTVGSASSGATTRADDDTADLFAVLWSLDPADAVITTSAGAASTRGASAAEDFAANKRLAVPDLRARFLQGLDDGRGVDGGRRLGSDGAQSFPAAALTSSTLSGSYRYDPEQDASDAYLSLNQGSSPVVPRNVAVLAIIKL